MIYGLFGFFSFVDIAFMKQQSYEMESKWALHEGHPRVTVLGSNLHNVSFLFDIDHKVTIA